MSYKEQQYLMDPMIISDDIDVLDCGVTDFDKTISDHRGTYVNITTQVSTKIAYTREVWSYNRGDFNKLNLLINSTICTQILTIALILTQHVMYFINV